jgi:parallel beta-helix repeat protein
MKNKKVKLLYLAVYLTIVLILLSLLGCSSPTETPKGSLTGMINLEGLSDHSGIIIALYDLAYLDTTIVRINNQYPQIGVHINQHTEFDHRLQSPIKTTETLADGSFEIKKIPTSIYNLVAIKDGWGFKYLYEIVIEEGDNDLMDVIYLYEEIYISGNISDNVVVATNHHLVIDDDTDFIPGSSLTIEPGAVIRINPGVDLTIYGNLTAQGEENNMFWVTSNDGLGEEITVFATLQYYNQMELSSIAYVEDNLIEWGRWDYANTCLLNQVNNMNMKNGILRDGNYGFYCTFIESTFCKNLLIDDCINESAAGIYYNDVNEGIIEKNIIIDCENGIKIKTNSNPVIKNNYIANCNYGAVFNYSSSSEFHNNDIYNSYHCVNVTTNSNPIIYFNNMSSDIGVYNYYTYCNIHHNNINSQIYAIQLGFANYGTGVDIDAVNNYFFTIDEREIQYLIFDNHDVEENYQTNIGEVYFSPFSLNRHLNAGIEVIE